MTERTVLQINRALPPGRRVIDTTTVELNRSLIMSRVTDTTLVQLNRALEKEKGND